jgi:hypothetical protein
LIMKYEYAVIVEKERNGCPDHKIQDRLNTEYIGWEVVSASTTIGPYFMGTDNMHHIEYATTVILRRSK